MGEEIGAGAAGVIEVFAPTEEPLHGEGDLGSIAQESLPIEVRAGLGVRVGDRHALAPITAPVVAGLHVLEAAGDAFLHQVAHLAPGRA